MTLMIRTLAATYYDGYYIEPHAHSWGQLIFAAQGVMGVQAGDRFWLIPPQRALWVPPGVTHEIRARGDFQMRTLYLAPRLCRLLRTDCRGIDVAPFLREFILHVVGLGMLDGANARDRRLIGALTDQIARPETLPLSLTFPNDRRARVIARRLQRNPGDPAELTELARAAGASPRTVQRLFLRETGLRFVAWRRRLRLLHAASLLGTGASVADSGFQAGYQSTSAFVAAFRAELGCTPARISAARGRG